MQEYITADISYTINTEAGFLIGRKGVVSMTSVGPFIQGENSQAVRAAPNKCIYNYA